MALNILGTPAKIEMVGDLKDVVTTPNEVAAVKAALETPAPVAAVKADDEEEKKS